MLLFVASHFSTKTYFVYPTATLVGLGGAMMWVGQGDYVSYLALVAARKRGLPDDQLLGMYQGIFFGVFNISQILGNLISFLILRTGEDSSGIASKHALGNLLSVYLVCIALALVVLLVAVPSKQAIQTRLLKEAGEKEGGADAIGVDTTPKQSIRKNLLATLRLIGSPRMALLLPMFFLVGLHASFAFGDFTRDVVTEGIDQAAVGKVMIMFGITSIIFSLITGPLSDKLGRPIVLAVAIVLQIGYMLWLYLTPNVANMDPIVIFVFGGLFGTLDSTLNTISSTLLAACFPQEKPAAFSNFRLFQAVGAATGFFLSKRASFGTKCLLQIFVVVLTGCCFFVDWWFLGLDRAQGKLLEKKPERDRDDL
eukprot:c15830_g1_i2.p1 GENE.c15830_g1_i2~~c15830_g1_i2.p1  ORF type:complete len:368 (+),score=83.98 c15830_g1_i2:361-1464(+)